jgi:hypothetical protein
MFAGTGRPLATERRLAAEPPGNRTLPHRATDPALLIVARWPAPGQRDEVAESEVEALIELGR